MTRGIRQLFFALIALNLGAADLSAQAPKNQQQHEETVRSAQRAETLGYILAGAGFLLIAASIPLAIYWDRKKKARKLAGRKPPNESLDDEAPKS